MLRLSINRSMLYAFFFPFTNNINPPFDNASKQIKQPEIIEMESLSPGEIGIDRLKNMFSDSHGNVSKELQSIISAMTAGVIGGFMLGGVLKTINVPQKFVSENQATRWISPFEAKKQLNNTFVKEFIKGGIQYGWKVGLFTFFFHSTTVMLYVYRGKFEVFNSSLGGALTGSIYKINMGLKGMVAGAAVGSILGTVYGLVTKMFLLITGVQMDDLYEVHLKIVQNRRDKLRNVTSAYVREEGKLLKQQYLENKILQETVKSK